MQFIRTTLFQSHETLDHPLGIVYAVDAHASDCAAAAVDLLRPHLQPSADDPSIPPAMASASVLPFWDPDFPRHFVLVADVRQGALSSDHIKSQAEALVKAVNSAIPGGSMPRVSMLTLNSGSGSNDEAGAVVDWAKHIHSTLPSMEESSESVFPSAGEPLERPGLDSEEGPARGCWLSTRNLDDTRALISTIIRALPYHHRQLADGRRRGQQDLYASPCMVASKSSLFTHDAMQHCILPGTQIKHAKITSHRVRVCSLHHKLAICR